MFDLSRADGGIEFLLGLYNFGTEIDRMAKAFDKDRLAQLKALTMAGQKLSVWSSRSAAEKLRVEAEANAFVPDCIATAVHNSEELELAMQEFGLTDDLFMFLGVSTTVVYGASLNIPSQYPFVAMVVMRSRDNKQYILKLLRGNRAEEVDTLEYLAQFKSPDNHVVRPIDSRECDLGTLLLLPHAGVDVTEYKDLHANIFSIASQFIRCVAFIHKHDVAHCDLKPGNVIVDRDTGRMTLIDFDLSVHGLDALDGFTGTDGWTAPEVGEAPSYDPFKADVWSAGKVLREMCSTCPDSAERKFLRDLSKKMSVDDPKARPSMKDVVRDLDGYLEGRVS